MIKLSLSYITVFFCCIGNVYIADCFNNAIRKVTVSTDIITTIVGTFNGGFSGDGGQATSAELLEPNWVALDSSGKTINCYLPRLALL